jgi:hypothetical protein
MTNGNNKPDKTTVDTAFGNVRLVIQAFVDRKFKPMRLTDVMNATQIKSATTAQRVMDNLVEAGWFTQLPDKKYEFGTYLPWLIARRHEQLQENLKQAADTVAFYLSIGKQPAPPETLPAASWEKEGEEDAEN